MSSPDPDPRPSPALSAPALLAAAVTLVVADQVSKHWAVNALDDGRIINVVGSLRFALGYNSGFAFGTAEGWGRWIGLVAIIVIIALMVSALRATGRSTAWGFTFIAAGAAGNVVDRLFRGEGMLSGSVVDFIDLQWWPVFNLADSTITVGAVLALIGSFLDAARERVDET